MNRRATGTHCVRRGRARPSARLARYSWRCPSSRGSGTRSLGDRPSGRRTCGRTPRAT
jgi:hypothetical protein